MHDKERGIRVREVIILLLESKEQKLRPARVSISSQEESEEPSAAGEEPATLVEEGKVMAGCRVDVGDAAVPDKTCFQRRVWISLLQHLLYTCWDQR